MPAAIKTETKDKKPLVIAGVVVVVVVLLGAFLYLGQRQFVGQAVKVTEQVKGTQGEDFSALVEENYVGGVLTPIELMQKKGVIISLPIWALVPAGKESVGYKVELTYRKGFVKVKNIYSAQDGDWGTDFFSKKEAEAGKANMKIEVQHATLDFTQALKGEAKGTAYKLVTIEFELLRDIVTAEDVKGLFDVKLIELYDLNDADAKNLLEGGLYVQATGQAKCGECKEFDKDKECKYSEVCKTKVTPVDVKELCLKPEFKSFCVEGAGGKVTFNANLNGDDVIDDRDALFIFQAVEAKQSAYNYCGATGEGPCVFGDRAICEDVSYVWTTGDKKHKDVALTAFPALPTADTTVTLKAKFTCPIAMGG